MCSLFGSRADRAAAGCRKMDVISCALLTELAEECVLAWTSSGECMYGTSGPVLLNLLKYLSLIARYLGMGCRMCVVGFMKVPT